MAPRLVGRQVLRIASSVCGIFKHAFLLLNELGSQQLKSNLVRALDTGMTWQPTYPSMQEEPTVSGILWAVQRDRRSLERRKTMRFGLTARFENALPKQNIVECKVCGHWHEKETICGHCYDKVRQKTAEIRALLEKDDQYYFDQTKDMSELLPEEAKKQDFASERERYKKELSWWSDNLKSKVL